MRIFLSGSMKNRDIRKIGNQLRAAGHDVFDDWWSPGPEADDCWQAAESMREPKRTYREALKGPHPQSAFQTDYRFLTQWADVVVMVMPCGKSAHMEMAFMRGMGKPAFIYMPTMPERFEIMHNFATDVFENIEELLKTLAMTEGR